MEGERGFFKKKVLVTSSDYPESELETLRDRCKVIQSTLSGFGDKDANKAEIEKLISGVDGIIWCTKVYLGKEMLDKAGKKLKVVATMSAGLDHIDVKELKKRKIALGNTPDVLNDAVADIAILLMISASRRLNEGIQQVKSGTWEIGPQKMLGQDINRSTVGIVGLGGIGQMIARRLSGFDIRRILYTGHKEKEEGKELGAVFVTLEKLLKDSDFIFLSCALNDETKHLINSETLSKMKKTAVLINVSRGDVIDQDALVDALKNNTIFAAGLDVTTPEPLPKDNPLISLPNCFISPHLGSATVRTRLDMAQLTTTNVLLGLNGEPLLTPV